MNTTRGFIVPLLLVIIALVLVGGGAYVYMQKKQPAPLVAEISAVKTGDSLTAGQTYNITWEPKDLTTEDVVIEILSSNSRAFINFIANNAPNNGNYSWTVDPKIPTGSYFISVTETSKGPGETQSATEGGNFSIISTVSTPLSPHITGVSTSTAYVDKTKNGFGSSVIIHGTGFAANGITTANGVNLNNESYAVVISDSSTGVKVAQFDANTSTGNPTSDTEFPFSVPNTTPPGSYSLVVENISYGLKSNSYPFTIVSAN